LDWAGCDVVEPSFAGLDWAGCDVVESSSGIDDWRRL
jgi:hypothetical protein